MANHHGDFVWYELSTSDPQAAQAFYAPMLGWTIRDAGMPDVNYRFAATAECDVAGIMPMPDDAQMPPAWLGYVGVDDVDAMAASFVDGGGAIHMPPWDIPGVGRMAFVSDPQRAMLYVMKPTPPADQPDAESISFSYDLPRPGHCAWNELATNDPTAALHFYGQRFGWVKDGSMDMGPLGEYAFLRHAGRGEPGTPSAMLGAIYSMVPEDPQPHWLFYFRVNDIDVALAQIEGSGGRIHQPITQIPGGDYSLIAADPQGAYFGLVGPRAATGAGS